MKSHNLLYCLFKTLNLSDVLVSDIGRLGEGGKEKCLGGVNGREAQNRH